MEQRRRPDVRRPPRLGRQPADVQHRRGQARRRPAGARSSPTRRSTQGKVTAYDSPIYIADAALYLMKTQPDLGIKDPYALDQKQLDAAVDLLKDQRENVSEYWSDYLKEVAGLQDRRLRDRHHLAGHRATSPRPRRRRSRRSSPSEGATGWSDTWMISSQGRAPELRLRVDVLHHRAQGRSRRSPSTSVRRRPTARPATLTGQGLLQGPTTPTTRPSPTRSGTGPRRSRSAWTGAPTPSAPTTATGPRPGPRSRADAWRSPHRRSHRRPRLAVAAAVPAAPPPMLWLGVAYLGALGGAVHHLAVDRRTTSPARSSGSGRSTTTATCDIPSTGRSRSARSASPRWSRSSTRCIAFPIALYMAKVASPAGAAAARDRGADAAVGVVPGQGLRLARHVRRRRADRLARRSRSGSSRRATGCPRPRSRWPTCGCRT